MDHPRIVLFTPSEDVATSVQQGLKRAGFVEPAEVFQQLPSVNLLKSVLGDGEAVHVAFLDYSEEAAAIASLAALRKTLPKALAVMVNGSRKLSSLVRSRQGGAWGYVADDYDMQHLAKRFGVKPPEPESESEPVTPVEGKLLAFIPAQGGNGASTVALHVADGIGELLGGHTLLADLDLHTGTAAFQLGVDNGGTLADALGNLTPQGLRKSVSRWRKLDLIASPPDPELVTREDLELLPLLLQTAREIYQFTILDFPAPLYRSSLRALADVDRVHIVCTAEITSLHLAKQKIERMRAFGIEPPRLRLLVNRVGSWGSLETRHIEQITGLSAHWALDNDYPAVRDAALRGGLVSADTELAQQLVHFSEHLIEELAPSWRGEHRSDAALVGA